MWGTEWCLRGEVSKAFNYHYIGLDSYKIFSSDGSARVLWNKVLLEDSSRNFGEVWILIRNVVITRKNK